MFISRLTILNLLFFFSQIFIFHKPHPSSYYPHLLYLPHAISTCPHNLHPLYLPYGSLYSTPKSGGLDLNAIATRVVIAIVLSSIIVYKLRQAKDKPSSSSSSSELCRRFSLAEIQTATYNFDDELVIGQNGYGKVYRGFIDNGARIVAINRLKPRSNQGASEYWPEIEMLPKLRHCNLISLIGYCHNGHEMILVYEYMCCGTLADHLYKTNRNGKRPHLSWVHRLKICIDVARGLDYLHSGTSIHHRIIRRDVKSSNILLNGNGTAKICNFGLSKICPINQSFAHVNTNIKGTIGYMDSEYFMTNRLKRKSDIYAFGVLLFEVLCGKPACDRTLDEDQWGTLAGWAQHCIRKGTVDQIIDPRLMGQISLNCLMEFVQIANQCVHNSPKKRPTISEVIFRLELALALQKSTDSSVFEGGIINTGEAYDNQENVASFTHMFQDFTLPQTLQESEDSSIVVREISNIGWAYDNKENAEFSTNQELANASNGGHHYEQIDGISNTNGIYDTQENSDFSTKEEVIHADNGGLQNEQNDGIVVNTGSAYDNQENADSFAELEVINAGNGGHQNEQIDGIMNSGEAYGYEDNADSSAELEVIGAGNGGLKNKQVDGIINTGAVYYNQENEQEFIGAGNGGRHNEQIDGTISTRGAYIIQENVDSSREHEVINAGNLEHHNDQIDGIILTGRSYHNQENADSYSYTEQELTNAANGGHHNEQIDRIIRLGDASGGQSRITPAKVALLRKVQDFIRDTTKVISGSDGMPSRMSKSNNCNGPLGGQIVTPNLKIFTFAELRTATNKFRFDMVLGEGDFGMIFKGWVDEKTYAPSKVGSGMAVVIKKLNLDGLLRPKVAQVKFLGKFSHPCLIKLLGYCLEDEEFFLVYEYMQKGSLERHLFRNVEPLPLATRLKIARGAARGLAFLHTTKEQVIYRGFKASNILLDEDFNAKISNFGLAKLVASTHTANDIVYMDIPKENCGYIAPEYMTTGDFNVKTDVYSFGVVLLEILTGMQVLDMNRPDGKQDLVAWARPFLTYEEKLKSVIDPRLEHDYLLEGVVPSTVAALILKCLKDYPRSRPSMKEVFLTLDQINALIEGELQRQR